MCGASERLSCGVTYTSEVKTPRSVLGRSSCQSW